MPSGWRRRRWTGCSTGGTSSGNADAKLVLIGHSMGGLIARYFVECLGGWQVTRTLMTLGTPHRGSLNAVGFLEQGMKKGIGPFGLDLLAAAALADLGLPAAADLPLRGAWRRGAAARGRRGARRRCCRMWTRERAKTARAFHQEIEDAQAANARLQRYADSGPTVVPVVGIEQPTAQSAQIDGGQLMLLNSLRGPRRRRRRHGAAGLGHADRAERRPRARSTPPRRMARCRTPTARWPT